MKKYLVVVVACLALLVSACGNSEAETSDLKKVKLMLDWTPNTNHNGIYLAQERGYYKDAGLEVEILQPGEQGGLQPLASGNVDFAVSVQESLIPAQAQGLPVVSIAPLLSTNTSSFLSLPADNITRPKDLEGKTYGGYGGDLERQLISTLVRCDGGDPDKVKFVDVGNVDFRVGLENNNYDFVWVYDGWDVIRFKQANMPVNTLQFSTYLACIPDWYTPLLATSSSKVTNDPTTVDKFMHATTLGYRSAIAEPAAAADALIKAAPELDAALVKESSAYLTKYYADTNGRWGFHDEATWKRFDDFLHTAGMIEKKSDTTKAFTNEFTGVD